MTEKEQSKCLDVGRREVKDTGVIPGGPGTNLSISPVCQAKKTNNSRSLMNVIIRGRG